MWQNSVRIQNKKRTVQLLRWIVLFDVRKNIILSFCSKATLYLIKLLLYCGSSITFVEVNTEMTK